MAIYDLSKEGWVPVSSSRGVVRLVGLEQVLVDAHRLGRLTAETPLCEAALLRLLVAIAHRIADVSDRDQWLALIERGSFDADRVRRYFSEWGYRFDLLDTEYPFYQDVLLSDVSRAPVSRLAFYSDAMPMVKRRWEKASPPLMKLGAVARYLLAYQTFDVGGFKSIAVPGENNSAKEAPLRSASVVMIQGRNLFETILFNMALYNPEAGLPWPCDAALDIPAWERVERNVAGPREPHGYLDWVTTQARRVLLRPELDAEGSVSGVRWVSITKGENAEERFLDRHRDPMVPYRWVRRDGKVVQVPVRLLSDRGAWRDGYGLLCSSGTRAVENANVSFVLSSGLFDGKQGPVDVLVVGMGTAQSKILFISSSGVRLPAAYFASDSEELLDALRYGLEIVEEGGSILRGVTREESPQSMADVRGNESSGFFWATVEGRVEAFVNELPECDAYEPRLRELVHEVADVADRALESVGMGSDRLMRLGRGSSKIRGILYGAANKIITGEGRDDVGVN